MAETTAILPGCVSQKRDRASPAGDLYRSALWQRRRGYAEASGRPWLILSALHGVLDPDTVIEPYDLALATVDAAGRREWGQRVVTGLERKFDSLAGARFEVHAGAHYRRAIAPGLEQRGATIDAPLEHRRLGEQLAWYKALR